MEHMATNRPTASHNGNAVSKVHSKTDVYVSRDSHTQHVKTAKKSQLEMWANAQRDGRPAEHRWRPLFNAAKFG